MIIMGNSIEKCRRHTKNGSSSNGPGNLMRKRWYPCRLYSSLLVVRIYLPDLDLLYDQHNRLFRRHPKICLFDVNVVSSVNVASF